MPLECTPVTSGMTLNRDDSIIMSSDTEGATVRFNINGEIPFEDTHCGYSYENSSRLYTEPVTVASLADDQTGTLNIIALALPADASQTMQSDLSFASFHIAEDYKPLKTEDSEATVAKSGEGLEEVGRHVFWAAEMGGGPSFDNCTQCKRNKNLFPTILAKLATHQRGASQHLLASTRPSRCSMLWKQAKQYLQVVGDLRGSIIRRWQRASGRQHRLEREPVKLSRRWYETDVLQRLVVGPWSRSC